MRGEDTLMLFAKTLFAASLLAIPVVAQTTTTTTTREVKCPQVLWGNNGWESCKVIETKTVRTTPPPRPFVPPPPPAPPVVAKTELPPAPPAPPQVIIVMLPAPAPAPPPAPVESPKVPTQVTSDPLLMKAALQNTNSAPNSAPMMTSGVATQTTPPVEPKEKERKGRLKFFFGVGLEVGGEEKVKK